MPLQIFNLKKNAKKSMSEFSNDKSEEVSVESEPVFKSFAGCFIQIPPPCCLVIFGATGDLTHRKLIPALYRLKNKGTLPGNFFILGAARKQKSTDQFREEMLNAVKSAFPEDFDQAIWKEFASLIYYISLDFSNTESYGKSLKDILVSLEKKYRTGGKRIFYLATPPGVFEEVVVNLGLAGLSRAEGDYSSIVIEKPFGRDLESARKLNGVLHKYFKEKQIFRIDHYLAKETDQNIIMFRFANSIFEPIWNRNYIDHVQITVAETLGLENRAGYYERTGVIRDMFQNHIFQLFALIAMDPPTAFEAERVRDEKVRVFRSVEPFPLDRIGDCVVIGQYGKGRINGEDAIGYREESGVSPGSVTPTFAAMKVLIDSWRWSGVPFYFRSGKRLTKRKTEISIHFKSVPYLMFAKSMQELIEPNVLVFRIQPDEGISLQIQAKKPGSLVCLDSVPMDFSYQKGIFLDAYEWVLLDCMIGDHLLFLREDGVESTWALLTPVIERLESVTQADRFPNYEAGSSGPEAAALLIERDGRSWRPL
jgi:glucose-6-phosphate 1-dehydrogenase